jgi:hypothetical protein
MERIYHTWDKWECYPAKFFEDLPPKNMTNDETLTAFAEFFRDLDKFEEGLKRVLSEWKYSCEHNLTNDKMNRVAWLGQAAICIMEGIPSSFRAGYSLLNEGERDVADRLALKYLNKWLKARNFPETDGKRNHKSANIY